MMLKELTGSMDNETHCGYLLKVETNAVPFDWEDNEKKSFSKRKALLLVSALFSAVLCVVSTVSLLNGHMSTLVVQR